MSINDYFEGIPKRIPYVGPAATSAQIQAAHGLLFRYYNKDEVILGKPMKEWLRFAVFIC